MQAIHQMNLPRIAALSKERQMSIHSVFTMMAKVVNNMDQNQSKLKLMQDAANIEKIVHNLKTCRIYKDITSDQLKRIAQGIQMKQTEQIQHIHRELQLLRMQLQWLRDRYQKILTGEEGAVNAAGLPAHIQPPSANQSSSSKSSPKADDVVKVDITKVSDDEEEKESSSSIKQEKEVKKEVENGVKKEEEPDVKKEEKDVKTEENSGEKKENGETSKLNTSADDVKQELKEIERKIKEKQKKISSTTDSTTEKKLTNGDSGATVKAES